jgi:hypothetical protein
MASASFQLDPHGVIEPSDVVAIVMDIQQRLSPGAIKTFFTRPTGYLSRWDNVRGLYRADKVPFPAWAHRKWAHSAQHAAPGTPPASLGPMFRSHL